MNILGQVLKEFITSRESILQNTSHWSIFRRQHQQATISVGYAFQDYTCACTYNCIDLPGTVFKLPMFTDCKRFFKGAVTGARFCLTILFFGNLHFSFCTNKSIKALHIRWQIKITTRWPDKRRTSECICHAVQSVRTKVTSQTSYMYNCTCMYNLCMYVSSLSFTESVPDLFCFFQPCSSFVRLRLWFGLQPAVILLGKNWGPAGQQQKRRKRKRNCAQIESSEGLPAGLSSTCTSIKVAL